MAKTLGGVQFVHNGVSQDYCFVESIKGLSELCDKVIVVDAGSTDETLQVLESLVSELPNVYLIKASNAEWHKHQGREKISFFQNLAAAFLTTDFYICVQSDECVHESSYPAIREAIETNRNGFFATRINLWGDSQHYLDVPQERQPVGIYIIRIARTGSKSVDDGESILVHDPDGNYSDKIRIYHMGFVRNQQKHIEKIKHIQGEVFQIEVDPRVIAMGDTFNPDVMFSGDDLKPILEPLPKLIQQWAAERDRTNSYVAGIDPYYKDGQEEAGRVTVFKKEGGKTKKVN